ncbi:hypothetical protein [Gracilimonas halophila]|uniref:Uncharacterized protein n=1 Tax=Gracilimonas halophila TaxID=1834464 RepID=A0ABW5JJZ9_9BACT
MKYTTIHLGTNKIELYNSLLGKETVKVNGETVSSKYSMLGAEHVFTINEEGQEVNCTVQFGFGMNGIVFDLHKAGQPVIGSEKSGCLGLVLMMVIIFTITVAFALLS